MKKHWLLCVGIVTCATLAAYVVGRLLLLPPDRITYATFGTITKGMSETEVVNILGGPPTREGDGAAWGGQLPVSGPFRVWSSGGNEIHVWFDQHGRVKLAAFRSDHATDYTPPLVDRLRRRLGL